MREVRVGLWRRKHYRDVSCLEVAGVVKVGRVGWWTVESQCLCVSRFCGKERWWAMGCVQSTRVFHRWGLCWLSGQQGMLCRGTKGVVVVAFESVGWFATGHCAHARVGRQFVRVGVLARCFEVATEATRGREYLRRRCRGVRYIWGGQIAVRCLDGM